jgi:signal transduction histidine kinase
MPCYRIVQEALTNAIRHARARSIVVRGRRVPAGVALVVRDDGVGFDLEAARKLGIAGERLGLIGMRERAEGIGANVEIASSPRAGTEIRLVVPDEGAT